jgi:hypothetical protein
MSEKIYSDNGDFIGTATYRENCRSHYRATTDTGCSRSVSCHKAAVAWLTTRYNSTH